MAHRPNVPPPVLVCCESQGCYLYFKRLKEYRVRRVLSKNYVKLEFDVLKEIFFPGTQPTHLFFASPPGYSIIQATAEELW